MKLADYFETEPSHPLPPEARRWDDLRRISGAQALQSEFVRPRDGLSFGPARLSVSFLRGRQEVPRDIAQWDLQLDTWLIEQGATAPSDQNEVERFGFRLRELLEHPEQRYGSGFFNSVLVHYLHDSELSKQPQVREMLASIHEYKHSQSESARDCADYIEQVFMEAAQQLTNQLGYPQPRAVKILSSAIAYYLDERFNVTTRKQLGFG